jgi:hypothetical protein
VEEAADTVYLVLPLSSQADPPGDELSNRELERVAGGDETWGPANTCPCGHV